jgi:hypothetical protein
VLAGEPLIRLEFDPAETAAALLDQLDRVTAGESPEPILISANLVLPT